ncbi:MAG: orotidine 5'-phosphate decarboxylase [Gemmatimonadetes bacterium GWC2_71_10]|nr:MAG: orotidine 5'-phosphate decarboxylase [Gemmatimonadetes bacterium GWC2_71_10]
MADIAVALDHDSPRAALALVDAAGAAGTWFKIGPVLFVRDGPALIRELLGRGKRVFLDLKWHDIPHTVAGAVEAAASLGVHLATVHLAGGRAMLEAAVGARVGDLRLAGVGVLTSHGAADYAAIVGRETVDTAAEQLRMARVARAVGLDAMVCAAGEAAALRVVLGPGRMLVVPGIRRSGEGAGDQVRTATPEAAVRAGADLLVIGRPITEAKDPKAALEEFRKAAV